MRKILIAPSLLAADFARLGEEVQSLEAAGADWLHFDVMDGLFVPNISFGAGVIRALRGITSLKFDVHMMVQNPERYIDDMAAAGANSITVHVEATNHIHRAIEQIAGHPGVVPGISLNPGTPVSALSGVLGDVGLVLVMTVNPGFGGQKLILSALDKIAEVRQALDAIGSSAHVQVDGGITAQNVAQFIGRGADVIVSGTTVLGAKDRAGAIKALRCETLGGAQDG
ncbi:MAG: ribulose-phosphate 3-epimerase [Oscillospiraceae bacterium]|nr:ribulose-phosphate 3-epimerase [Oscillospiraceae bacterium]